MDNLTKLHTTLIDTERGYEEAIKDAGESNLIPLLREMRDLHSRHHTELHYILLGMGVTPDDSGSFMSIVHKVVIDMRAAITGIDEKTLPSFIDGEENIVDLYRDALQESQSEPTTVEILNRQKQALEEQISKMKVMQPTNV